MVRDRLTVGDAWFGFQVDWKLSPQNAELASVRGSETIYESLGIYNDNLENFVVL